MLSISGRERVTQKHGFCGELLVRMILMSRNVVAVVAVVELPKRALVGVQTLHLRGQVTADVRNLNRSIKTKFD